MVFQNKSWNSKGIFRIYKPIFITINMVIVQMQMQVVIPECLIKKKSCRAQIEASLYHFVPKYIVSRTHRL
jgi:hypothetical protein